MEPDDDKWRSHRTQRQTRNAFICSDLYRFLGGRMHFHAQFATGSYETGLAPGAFDAHTKSGSVGSCRSAVLPLGRHSMRGRYRWHDAGRPRDGTHEAASRPFIPMRPASMWAHGFTWRPSRPIATPSPCGPFKVSLRICIDWPPG